LISRHIDGAIIQELFTHDGIGTMVTEMGLETIRQAEIGDVGGILQLIEPMEAEGILVRRGRERIEIEIDRFYVMEHDGRIIGCAALYPYPSEKTAELACVAIHPSFRGGGRGDRLFRYCEEQAEEMGLKYIFALTTHTAHWFVERGFIETDLTGLPKEKQQLYNLQRRSKIFKKKL
jgi:amino-acid N-acetyltransferase